MSEKFKDHPYYKQAKLMLESLPSVASEKCFALKGGTAINFFVRNMPRLSVDIDLTYLPIEDRPTSLQNITAALKRISMGIQKAIPDSTIQEGLIKNTKVVVKLYVTQQDTQIIIEPNLTLRGTLFPTNKRSFTADVAKHFESSASITVVSEGDLYGGKICAALDRQHPRDLYDVKILLENEGITEEIRKGFVIYLAGHDQTMSQLLSPELKDIKVAFETQFQGMPMKPATLAELLQARNDLIQLIRSSLTENERRFLLSLKEGSPEWNLLGIEGL